MKKEIKIKYVDFANDFDENNNDFEKILQEYYYVVHSDEPDYVFYSNFGKEHLKYLDKILIFYTGECETPNFNLCDYAMGFDYLSFGDRYCRVPLYQLFQYRKDYELAKEKHKMAESIFAENRCDCSFVVSNAKGMSEREQMFDLLSEKMNVYSGGKFRNNIGYCVPDKLEFQKKYKFSICFENCSFPGYTTEKIMQAFASGAIPIYMGDPIIDKFINPKSFVNCNDFDTLEDAVQYIIKINQDDDLYKSMLLEPVEKSNQEELLENFLLSIFSQDYDKARRRPRNERIEWIEDDCLKLETYLEILNKKGKRYNPIRKFKRIVKRIVKK